MSTCQQGLARLFAAAEHGTPYDAVFVDWIMPGLDGWQTCSRIRSLPAAAHTPLVIMVTAHGREMLDQQPAREQAMLDGFLVKPVTTGMLQAAFHRALHKPDAAAGPPATVPPKPLAGLRLLLAEDNVVNQQIATELLSRQGAQVDVVENGQLAVDRLDSGVHYDAVLMDVQMPVLDGLAATRAIRQRRGAADLPIVAMTANAMDSDRQACLDAGMNDHVAKPFAIQDVVAALLRHLAGQPQPGASRPAVAAPPAGPLPVFDLAGALERLGGDEELLFTILPVFRGNLEQAARELAASGDASAEQVSRLMHSVKGMAANLGAMQLATLAAQAEVQARAGHREACDAIVAQVHAAIAEVLQLTGRQFRESEHW
ncbi:MAG: response regulator [Comamonadaceae bacterium]|nr:MAG: response regulator [Comamonadaceae bacterium]